MIAAPFEYRTPASEEEAIALLRRHGDGARILAGGQSLVPALRARAVRPTVVVDLRRLPGAADISADGDDLRLGALVTHRQVELSTVVAARCPLIAASARGIGDLAVRSLGTVLGSLCQADPAADHPAVLCVLDARVEVVGPAGARAVRVLDFLQGTFETALDPGELARAVRIPRTPVGHAAYVREPLGAWGYALAGVACRLELEEGRIREARLGVTGVARRPFRAFAAEASLRGLEVGEASAGPATPGSADRTAAGLRDSTLREAILREAVAGIASGQDLLEDRHASAEYRAHLAEVLARRAVRAALSAPDA